MSVDDDDYAREEYEREIGDHFIAEFQAERLGSFFEAKPDAAVQMFDVLDDARRVVVASPRAGLILAYTACEVCIKNVLARGLIYGLVHSEAAADLISITAIQTAKLDNLKKMIAHVLQEVAKLDIDGEQIGNQTLWAATKAVQNKRNAVVHRGESASPADAQSALDVATAWCEGIVMRLLKAMHLGLTKSKQIQPAWKINVYKL